jgi:hypothetical protein
VLELLFLAEAGDARGRREEEEGSRVTRKKRLDESLDPHADLRVIGRLLEEHKRKRREM